MPIKRGSVKSRMGGKKKGWPSKTRSYPWRAGASRPKVQGLKGTTFSVARAPTVHRFTRWGDGFSLVNTDAGSGITHFNIVRDGGFTCPLTVGGATVDGAAANNYQIGGAMEFTLADVVQYTDFTTLFDQYTIEQVDIIVDSGQNTATQGVSTSMPQISYVTDFDDSNVPLSAGEISEYQRTKVHTFRGDGKSLKISIKPRVSVPIFYNGVLPAYAVGSANTVMDCANIGVPHYGLKMWFRNLYSGPTIVQGQTNIRFKVKYHLKFVDPK